jgi:hypothetical protein
MIPIPQDYKTARFKITHAASVSDLRCVFIMLTSIQLVAIEIEYIRRRRMLATEFVVKESATAQQLPHQRFGVCLSNA